MMAIALIVFREVIEAALIVSVVLAASRGIPGRGLWVSGGIFLGVLGAMLVAAFAEEISDAVAGAGQEIFNATILFAAVCMLGWHNIWMRKHGRELMSEANQVGDAVRAGRRPLYALAIVTGVAVLREGSEVVLFVFGIAAAQNIGETALLTGGAAGLAGGVAMGAALYWGLLTIPMRHLFQVTSWMILLLAAGMASQGAAFLVQAGLLPPLSGALWDSSSLLREDSLIGQALHALVGYVSHPIGIQLVFYIVTLAVIGGLMRLNGRDNSPREIPAKPAE
jgi:high-affinity iron transporter